MKSLLIKPFRCLDFRKAAAMGTVYEELDGEYTLKSLLGMVPLQLRFQLRQARSELRRTATGTSTSVLLRRSLVVLHIPCGYDGHMIIQARTYTGSMTK